MTNHLRPETAPARDRNSPDAADSRDPILSFASVSKSFHHVRVLTDVTWDLHLGETLGLVGENGAGKSTLMKIVAGIYPAGSYSGTIHLGGDQIAFHDPKSALDAGIVYVPQELMFSPGLSLAENMYAGRLPRKAGLVLDKTALNRSAKQALTDFGVDADPRRLAGDYSPATQRLATIAAALSEKARVLILDEPTAALTEQETERLFARVAALHAKGVSCIHITHRLDEVEQYASRVVVLRNGEVATRLDQARGHHGDMVRAMIGREPEEAPVRPSLPLGKSRLNIRGMTVWEGKASESRARVQGIDLDVRPGEVLGIYGLVGSGRTEMARAIFGDWSGDVDGQMLVDGRPTRFRSPRDAVAHGTVMLPEDRKVSGVVAGQTVNYNMSASSTDSVARVGVIKHRIEARRNRGFLEGLDIRPAKLDIPIETMSGGNQQKVLLARCLATNPSILILDEPTVGVDVGARFEIFKIIRRLAEQGLAVLLISSDLAEISAESDRIMVMYKGRIVREFRPGASRAELMAAATGVGVS